MNGASEQRADGMVRLADYRPTPHRIDGVFLDFRLDEAETVVTAEIGFSARPETAPGTALVLDGDEIDLVSVALDGATLAPEAYEASPAGFTLKAPPAVPFRLTFVTRLKPAENTKLMGLYRSSGNWCTQCEAEGFRRITYFHDRPDVLAVYRTRIEAPKASARHLLGNGNPTETGDVGADRHYAIWDDPFPKPAYLFAMVAGTFDVLEDTFVTASGRTVALGIHVEHGRGEKAGWAMDALKRSMRWDEEAFGREYDLDVFNIVAVSDFNMGAMENKGLNVFNDKYVLASPRTATDTDYANIEGVIAHEYFHNWTGNRITCRDWFQLCLKEGLTVFRDQEFSADQRSRAVKRIADVRLLKSHQFPEDAGPLAHPCRPNIYKEINNFYTATVYEKGAEVVRMLKTLVGADDFRAGMDLYFERHDGEAATVEQFVACFAERTTVDLSRFMLWYTQSGTPEVIAQIQWDAANGRLSIAFDQTVPPTPGQPVKSAIPIPVRFGLVGSDGSDMHAARISGATVRGDVIVLDKPHHDVVFEGLAARPAPSLLRGFSAPVRLSTNLDVADQAHLAATDVDPFNRWQAIQGLALAGLMEATAAIRAGREPAFDPRIVEAIVRTAGEPSLEPSFRALAVALPTEADVAREIAVDVDPDAIFEARRQLRGLIAREGRAVFADIWAKTAATGPFSPDAAAAGRRALRNAALDYLAIEDAGALVAEAYGAADNMTDRLAALAIAVGRGQPRADELLADFHARFVDDPLVIDKWLMVQATAPLPGTLDRVRALTGHPSFAITNPNRVTALITTFASGNQTQFNRPDGAGYVFVADRVLELDRLNPHLASRLLSTFRSWRALEPRRRAWAEAELKRVAATAGLSRDVADIAERSLG